MCRQSEQSPLLERKGQYRAELQYEAYAVARRINSTGLKRSICYLSGNASDLSALK